MLALVVTSAPLASTPEAPGISCIAPLAGPLVGTADTGNVFAMHDLPRAGVLIAAEKGLFLARSANGAATVEPVGNAETGLVHDMHDPRGRGC
jgi:hypothetical protein